MLYHASSTPPKVQPIKAFSFSMLLLLITYFPLLYSRSFLSTFLFYRNSEYNKSFLAYFMENEYILTGLKRGIYIRKTKYSLFILDKKSIYLAYIYPY